MTISNTQAAVIAGKVGSGGGGGDISEVKQIAENALSLAQSIESDLTNYYTKSETYTQDEIDQMISTIPKFSIAVVDALPTTDISDTTVYLVKSAEETGNLYTEYIHVGDTWEMLGTQKTDLSGYYTSAQVDEKMAEYLPLSGGTLESSDYDILKINRKDPSDYATSTGIRFYLNGKNIGSINMSKLDGYIHRNDPGTNTYVVLDSGNFRNYALPLSGNATSATKLEKARTINGVSFDGTSDIEILPPYMSVNCGISSYETRWFKVAEMTPNSNSGANVLSLHVHYIYPDHEEYSGVLSVSASKDTNRCYAKWEYANGEIDLNSVVISHTSTNIELWAQAPSAGSSAGSLMRFTEIGESYNHTSNTKRWSLCANASTGSASYPSGTTIITSTLATIQNPVAALTDSGWVDCTTSTTYTTGGTVKYRVVGKQITIVGDITLTGIMSHLQSTPYTIATMPSGFPAISTEQYCVAYMKNASTVSTANITVSTDGTIGMNPAVSTDFSSGYILKFTFTGMID